MDTESKLSFGKITAGIAIAMFLGTSGLSILESDFLKVPHAENVSAEELSEEELKKERLIWSANSISEITEEINNQIKQQEKEPFEYTIQWGDTVWGITQAYDLDLKGFVTVNNIEDPSLIYADDVVLLVDE